jgi:hypothetical protein
VYLGLPTDGFMLLRGVARDKDIAGDGNTHRLERVACRLKLAPVERDAFANLLRRRELGSGRSGISRMDAAFRDSIPVGRHGGILRVDICRGFGREAAAG